MSSEALKFQDRYRVSMSRGLSQLEHSTRDLTDIDTLGKSLALGDVN